MAIITPSDLSFNGKEVRTFAEAIMESLYDYPALNQYTTVIPGIKAKQQIALLGRLKKITHKDAGCGTKEPNPNIPMTEKSWDPQDLKIWLNPCWTDFEATFMVYYLKVKTDKPDLTTTEIFSQWLTDEVDNAANEDAIRIGWFADKAIAAGNLTGGAGDVKNYNQIDGLWKQLFGITAATAARRTMIAKNTAGDKASQAFTDADVQNQVATNIFLKLVMSADTRLRANPNGIITATRSLTDQYILERFQKTGVELAYTRLESGIDTLNILGKRVYVVDQWDRIIQSDLINTADTDSYYLPHRAVYSTPENLQFGLDGDLGPDGAPTNWRVWYSDDLETSNIKGLYKFDAKVIEDYMVQVAY